MAIAPFEVTADTVRYLEWLNAELAQIASSFCSSSLAMPTAELARTIIAVEEVARTVDQLQLIGAHAVEQQNVAVVGESGQRLNLAVADGSSGESRERLNRTGCRDNAEYLRNTLRISKHDAKRRIRAASGVMSSVQLNGQPLAPRLEHLAEAVSRSAIGSQAVTMISAAIDRVRSNASAEDLDQMEACLTRQAVESDLDVLRVLIHRWEDLLSPDGKEPTEDALRARQGVFLRGKRHGLHFIEIAATDEQYEDLVTVMYSATNPRARAGLSTAEAEKLRSIGQSGELGAQALEPGEEDAGPLEDLDRSTWAQQLLDGLVGACRIAAASNKLPHAGGMRPQVLVTIDYKELVADVTRTGHAAFGGLLSTRAIRRIACDADILPVVLGSHGQILDVGQQLRLFPPGLRKALVARDGGCAFPDCMMPSPWTEAHHIVPWSRGGPTSTDNGVLLCTRHHHLLHQEEWTIEVRHRVPWFIPPRYIDPSQSPRQNRYHRARDGDLG